MRNLKKYLLLIICEYLSVISSQEIPESSCPNIFQYGYDNKNNLIGYIQVSTPNVLNNVILLQIQLSVGNKVKGSNGNIILLSPRTRIIDDLLQKRPIQYKLEFPNWLNVPPRVTRIAVNGKQICFGYAIDRRVVPVVTTINLQHTLTISMPLSIGSNLNNGASHFLGDSDEPTYSYSVSYSNPTNPIFNFNPQPPQDPSKIYASNPFLNQNNKVLTGSSSFYQKLNPSGYNAFNTGYQNYPGWFSSNNGNFFSNSEENPTQFDGTPQYNYQQRPQNQFSFVIGSPNNFTPRPKEPDQENPRQRPQNQFSFVVGSPNIGSVFVPTESPKAPEVKDPTVKPNIEPHFLPTQSPKEPDLEDLPTVESNLVKKPFSGVCGISVNTNALLINGNRVAKGVHPWLAALFRQDDEGLKFICGSTLISQKHVVTAAHCVQSRSRKTKPELLWSVLGRENIQRWSNDGAQIIQAESTHVHPDFQFNTADADIAVILLTEEVIFSTLIKPICLWTSEPNQKLIVEKLGTVAGWGKDQDGKVSTSEPRQLSFPVVSEEDCLRSNVGFRDITSNRTFCAGYRNNSGPCNGDSGSGFLIKKDGRWTLRGIVSTSLRGTDGECDLKQYIVFTDAAIFMEWLLSFVN